MKRVVNIDINSLLSDANSPVTFPLREKHIPDLSGEVLLMQHKNMAESKLIKASLIKKVYEGVQLTKAENKYMKKWFEEIRSCKDEEMVRFTCLPKNPSKLSLSQLTGMDRYKLNSIPLVNITTEYSNFGLTDLIFELSHFIDESFVESVRRIEIVRLRKRCFGS